MTAVEEVGLYRVLATADVHELLLLADATRLGGFPDRSRQVLESLRQRFPGTAEAGAAAFRMGRLLANDDPEAAASWFGTYLKEQPSGELAREAMGRQLEQLTEVDADQARAVARRYLARWPEGPHASLASSVLK